MTRRAAVTKVQIARRDLGLDDATYRAMLERLTGRTSSTDCTDAQLGLVLDEFKAKGWKPRVVKGGRSGPVTPRAAAQSPVALKARALWISLHQLGVVRDPSEKALEAFGRRQLGVDRLQWANQSQGFRLIEALKAMAERAGWKQTPPAHLENLDPVRSLKVTLILALCAKLSMNARFSLLGLSRDGLNVSDEFTRWDGLSDRYVDQAIRDLAAQLADRRRA